MNQNDVERRRGLGDAYITVSSTDVFEQLLLRAWVVAEAMNR